MAETSVSITSECAAATRWTVLRQESKRGPVSPIRLEWKQPVSAVDVWAYIMQARIGTDPEWNQCRHFEAYPTDEKQPGGQHRA